MEHREIECRFLEVDKESLIRKLNELGAEDEGETMLEETIIYDPELKWRDGHRFVRLRKIGDKSVVTYKEHQEWTVDGMLEIEFGITDFEKAELLFEKIGLVPFRHQQKKRHTFKLGKVTVYIDTWPKIPTYVELEGESEEALKEAAEKIGLDWSAADFHSASWVIENKYNIQVRQLRWFTFDRVE